MNDFHKVLSFLPLWAFKLWILLNVFYFVIFDAQWNVYQTQFMEHNPWTLLGSFLAQWDLILWWVCFFVLIWYYLLLIGFGFRFPELKLPKGFYLLFFLPIALFLAAWFYGTETFFDLIFFHMDDRQYLAY